MGRCAFVHCLARGGWPAGLFLILAAACSTPPPVTGSESGGAAYRAAFHRALGTRVEAPVPAEELWQAVRRARVLLLGDHHADRAYHRRLPAFLDALALQVGPLCLCVEFLTGADRCDLEAFLAGRLTPEAFRRRVAARDPGGILAAPNLDGQGLVKLLIHARARAWPVEPLEPVPGLPLPLRDAAMATTVARVLRERGGHYPVVFAGQAHLLGRGHLRERLPWPTVVVLARGPAPVRGLGRVRPGVYVLGTLGSGP